MCRLILLALLSLGAFVACQAVRVRAGGVRLGPNPGATVRVRRQALDKFFASIAHLSSKYIHKVPIPDFTATVAGVTLQTNDIRVTQFPEPVIKYRLAPPNVVVGALELPKVGISGPFKASRTVGFGTVQEDSGLLVFNATAVRVAFQATIGEFENGIPQISNFECQSSLGHPTNLHVKNAQERFVAETLGVAAQTIRPGYDRLVCSTAQKVVEGQINRFLSKIPNVININPNLAIKFQVKPEVYSDYVQVNFYGKIITGEVNDKVPAKFVETPDDNAFVTILISDNPFNDAAFQFYHNKLLEWTINKNSHPAVYSLLKLKCDSSKNEACLGNVAPDLEPKYRADADVEAVFRNTEIPKIEFLQDKATFSGNLQVELFITPQGGKKVSEANLTIENSGSLLVRIKDGVLWVKISIDQQKVTIDDKHSKKWEDKIRNVTKEAIEQYVNGDLLAHGIPLKIPFGIGVKEPLIKFAPHTLQVHTAFEYKAKTSSEEGGPK